MKASRLGAVLVRLVTTHLAIAVFTFGQFSETVGNPLGGGKNDCRIPNGGPAELAPDRIDGPVDF